MQRNILLSILATSLIATSGFVLAQNAPPPPSPNPSTQAAPMPMRGQGRMGPMELRRGMHGGKHHRMGRHGGPVGAVIGDLHQLSRLYIMDGKTSQLQALYKEVLGKTQNPMVRNYVYRALARLQSRPRDPSAAIATLRKSLNENLERLNAMPARRAMPAPKR